MSEPLVARLRRLADALPNGAAVVFTRADLLDLLHSAVVGGDPGDADLTCTDVAHVLGCSDSAVRRLLEGGLISGYKLNPGRRGSWRVPRASLQQFRDAQQNGQELGHGRGSDLGRWRRVRHG